MHHIFAITFHKVNGRLSFRAVHLAAPTRHVLRFTADRHTAPVRHTINARRIIVTQVPVVSFQLLLATYSNISGNLLTDNLAHVSVNRLHTRHARITVINGQRVRKVPTTVRATRLVRIRRRNATKGIHHNGNRTVRMQSKGLHTHLSQVTISSQRKCRQARQANNGVARATNIHRFTIRVITVQDRHRCLQPLRRASPEQAIQRALSNSPQPRPRRRFHGTIPTRARQRVSFKGVINTYQVGHTSNTYNLRSTMVLHPPQATRGRHNFPRAAKDVKGVLNHKFRYRHRHMVSTVLGTDNTLHSTRALPQTIRNKVSM